MLNEEQQMYRKEAAAAEARWKLARDQREAELLNEYLPTLRKIAMVAVERRVHHESETFELRLVLDPIAVRMALIQGNSEQFLRFYAERLSQQIYHELRTVNLQRFNDEMLDPEKRRAF